MTHTHGPWSIKTKKSVNSGDVPIADVWGDDNLDDWASEIEAEANTRLIAAAPELLAACEALLNVIYSYQAQGLMKGLTFSVATDAIEKATKG